MPELQRTQDEHIEFACSQNSTLAPFDANNIWTVVGEWTAVITDCAKWLNGRGVGARWDGTWFPTSDTPVLGTCTNLTGDSSTFSDDYKVFLRKYVYVLLFCYGFLLTIAFRVPFWDVFFQLGIGKSRLTLPSPLKDGYGGRGR